jgi:hypothetical protein
MVAGADSIDDLDVLRHGGLSRLSGGVRAVQAADHRARAALVSSRRRGRRQRGPYRSASGWGRSNQQARARQIAKTAIRKGAAAKNRPADLINIALEKVVAARLDLPWHPRPHERCPAGGAAAAAGRARQRRTTQYNRSKQTAQGPTWSHFKRLFTHLEWLDKLGDTSVWVNGVAAP